MYEYHQQSVIPVNKPFV